MDATALSEAALHQWDDVVVFLVEKGAMDEVSDEYRCRALCTAVRAGRYKHD